MTYQRRMQECEESKNDYASQLQATNKYQHEYYTAHMPTVFKVTFHYTCTWIVFLLMPIAKYDPTSYFFLGQMQNIVSPILILMFVLLRIKHDFSLLMLFAVNLVKSITFSSITHCFVSRALQ